MSTSSRRLFLASSASLIGGVAVVRPAFGRPHVRPESSLTDHFPAHDPTLVKEIVGKSHANLAAVEELVKVRPALAKSAWDWGFGDWESALGAASHMGRRDIAELLIAHGARPNLFTFAMLGQIDVVRAFCEANSGIQSIPGPHGISLLSHARNGGDEAADVVEYLESLGGADPKAESIAISEGDAKKYVGAYRATDDPAVTFNVKLNPRRKVLQFQRDDRVSRFLHYRGGHEFAPSGGSPETRVLFDVRGDVAVSLTVVEGDLRIGAERMDA